MRDAIHRAILEAEIEQIQEEEEKENENRYETIHLAKST